MRLQPAGYVRIVVHIDGFELQIFCHLRVMHATDQPLKALTMQRPMIFSICPLPLCSCTASHLRHIPRSFAQPVLAVLILENAAHLPKVPPLESDLEARLSNVKSEAHWEGQRRPPALPRQILLESEAKVKRNASCSFGKSCTEVLQSYFTTGLAAKLFGKAIYFQTFEEYSEVSPIKTLAWLMLDSSCALKGHPPFKAASQGIEG